MDDSQIKAARALCDAANPGPWKIEVGQHQGRDWPIASLGHSDELPAGVRTVTTDGVGGSMLCGSAHDDARFIAAARTLVPALLDALAEARRDLAIAHHDASQLSGNANRVLRELKERMFAKIERYERDAEAAQVDLAATKAALVEAMTLATDAVHTLSCWVSYIPDFKNRLAALKAKVQP